jgi:hypothetical protein
MNTCFAFMTAVSAALFLSACLTDRDATHIISIDVSKSYPEKTIKLSEIAAVDYVSFHSADGDSAYQGRILSITPNVIVFHVFDEDPRAFTRYGRPLARAYYTGARFHSVIYRAVYDEAQDELFVLPLSNSNRIDVYTLDGRRKRTLTLPEGSRINRFYSADGTSLLVNDVHNTHEAKPSFIRINKADGRLIARLPMPENPRPAWQHLPTGRLVKGRDGYLVYNPECDTVFTYGRDLRLIPVMVQAPSAASTRPLTSMDSYVEAGPYQFIRVFRETSADSLDYSPVDSPDRYSVINLMRHKTDGVVHTAKVLMDDYEGREVSVSPSLMEMSEVPQLGSMVLHADELERALEDGRLSGKLGEMAARSARDGSDVHVVMKFK